MQKVRILIVEDDMITATDLSQHLHRMGYDIVGIMTKAEDALQHLEKDPPDIILMDIQLRGMMNGIEAAKEIKQNHKEIIVIFLTANFDDETYNQAKLTKPQSFISKPFNNRELSRAIELAILNRQGHSKKDPDGLQSGG